VTIRVGMAPTTGSVLRKYGTSNLCKQKSKSILMPYCLRYYFTLTSVRDPLSAICKIWKTSTIINIIFNTTCSVECGWCSHRLKLIDSAVKHHIFYDEHFFVFFLIILFLLTTILWSSTRLGYNVVSRISLVIFVFKLSIVSLR